MLVNSMLEETHDEEYLYNNWKKKEIKKEMDYIQIVSFCEIFSRTSPKVQQFDSWDLPRWWNDSLVQGMSSES